MVNMCSVLICITITADSQKCSFYQMKMGPAVVQLVVALHYKLEGHEFDPGKVTAFSN